MNDYNIITTDEYFNLLDKNNLTPEETEKKNAYEKFISRCKEYDSLISPTAQSILNDYNTRILNLETKPERSSHEEKVLEEFKENLQDQDSENIVSIDGPTRILSKAGYMDATIILALLLNVGFIIAMAILGS